jgi:hypothetical protein
MDFDLSELTAETPQGVLCQVKIGNLKPTQNAVGFDEVNEKIARYSAKSKADLRDYLLVHPVPVVIGNGGNCYLTDYHHLANDPYRSLAWEVRTRYGYGKSPHAFAEFLQLDGVRSRKEALHQKTRRPSLSNTNRL